MPRRRKHQGRQRGRNNRKHQKEYSRNGNKEPNSHYHQERNSVNGDDPKSGQRRLEIIFVISIITLIIISACGYYIYENYWRADENGSEEPIDMIDDGNGGVSEKDDIEWLMYNAGLDRAATENKPVIIDFYYDTCYWCIELDENTYTDERVINKSKEFISVKVDLYEKVAYNGQQLTDQYQVTGFPTIVFLDPNGDEVKRIRGYVGPGPFLEDMDYVLNIT